MLKKIVSINSKRSSGSAKVRKKLLVEFLSDLKYTSFENHSLIAAANTLFSEPNAASDLCVNAIVQVDEELHFPLLKLYILNDSVTNENMCAFKICTIAIGYLEKEEALQILQLAVNKGKIDLTEQRNLTLDL